MSLDRNKHRSPLHALLYFTDCQIATFAHFAYRKSAPKNETRRHYSIAKDMLVYCKQFVDRGVDDLVLVDALLSIERRFREAEVEYQKSPAGAA